jgi:[ribosomal protein S5]-alanine N-acetyltransferase
MQTHRIKLINCTPAILQKALEGDRALAEHLGVTVPDIWTEFGRGMFEYVLQAIADKPEDAKWWTYLPIYLPENVLVGTCGYKGSPNAEGMIEIGYETAEDYRGNHLATEMAKLLIGNALAHPEVNTIRANTLSEYNASTKVLEKCGFKFLKEVIDPTDGPIWFWQIDKAKP